MKSLQGFRDKTFSCYTTFVELITDNLAAGAGTHCAPRVKPSIQSCFLLWSEISLLSEDLPLNRSGLQNKLLDQNNKTASTQSATAENFTSVCPQQASVFWVPRRVGLIYFALNSVPTTTKYDMIVTQKWKICYYLLFKPLKPIQLFLWTLKEIFCRMCRSLLQPVKAGVV